MFLIATINKLDKRLRLLLISIFVLIFIVSTVALFFYIQYIQTQQKAISLEKSVSTLRTQALKAQLDGDLDKADKLYSAALAEAENSGSSMKVIEFLSRLVQIKIQNHKLGQTDALVQKAVALALSMKDKPASDSNLEVWMDDMANAFYKRGEHSTRDDIKEYCLKHYLDIKLPLEDRFDNILVSRADSLLMYWGHNGRNSENTSYAEQVFKYLQRTKSNDPAVMAIAYRYLISVFLQRRQFVEAESTASQMLKLTSGGNGPNETELNWELGHLKEAEGNLQAAKIFYEKVVNSDKGEPTVWMGLHKNILAFADQRLNNFPEAAKLYKASLDCFDHCHPFAVTSANAFLHPEGWFYSGQVFANEHLAEIELKQGNISLARSLRAEANKIRARNPHWNTAHPNPDNFYSSAGFFPFKIELIPTHFSLQEINPN